MRSGALVLRRSHRLPAPRLPCAGCDSGHGKCFPVFPCASAVCRVFRVRRPLSFVRSSGRRRLHLSFPNRTSRARESRNARRLSDACDFAETKRGILRRFVGRCRFLCKDFIYNVLRAFGLRRDTAGEHFRTGIRNENATKSAKKVFEKFGGTEILPIFALAIGKQRVAEVKRNSGV